MTRRHVRKSVAEILQDGPAGLALEGDTRSNAVGSYWGVATFEWVVATSVKHIAKGNAAVSAAVLRASRPQKRAATATRSTSEHPKGGKMPPRQPAGCQRYDDLWQHFHGLAPVGGPGLHRHHLSVATPSYCFALSISTSESTIIEKVTGNPNH